ncbi:sodium/glutamate symporter [Pseudoalteromonas sp. C2R02]|uniref:sodium/glutamate symporter n=1 Tax=Pseudoalteromonas sp. C2R02 TaxID=2841565 RepID=UPI001C09F137|nr:sodium/glutamate symporter [Pseudoalteromonas sp. C2R02]MBU2970131.1 sodium/glutamate symporter [Pseudoalteromonas sp. C2R02]
MEFFPRQTVIIAVLVLFLGKFLTKRINALKAFNIPEPVTGGMLASVCFSLIYVIFDFNISFSLMQRDVLLVIFFTTIGLNAKFSTLLEGGKSLVILLLLAICYLFLQNLTGIGATMLTDLPPATGVLGGSVSLSGGHGTAIAWAPSFENRFGVINAAEIGIACATFGLVLGGVIGGPVAKYLINKHNLSSTSKAQLSVGIKNEKQQSISVDSVLTLLLVLSIAVGLGLNLHKLLASMGVMLPIFVPCLFAGILLTNSVPLIFKKISWVSQTPTLALVSDLSLGLFLAMSLMSLQLWALIDLAGPILLILAAQLILTLSFSIFFVFRFLGKNYDAAVITSGYAGLALGATPTAIANMTAVTKKYGASPKAFIIVPLVGAFFIDLTNAVIIQMMLNWIN